MKYFQLLFCCAALFAAFLISGCYESGNGSQDGVTDPVPDAVVDTAQDPDVTADPDVVWDLDALTDPDEIDQIICQFGAAFVAQFDKSCSDSNDCGTVYFSNDCCGTTLAAGVNVAEVDRFNDIWEDCLLELPMCGCPSGPPVAEDGNTAMSLEIIQVACDGGRCMTWVPEVP